jgi:hypothetical protein
LITYSTYRCLLCIVGTTGMHRINRCSVSCLQEPATRQFPKPDDSSAHPVVISFHLSLDIPSCLSLFWVSNCTFFLSHLLVPCVTRFIFFYLITLLMAEEDCFPILLLLPLSLAKVSRHPVVGHSLSLCCSCY